MKAPIKKSTIIELVSHQKREVGSKASNCPIRIKAVTTEERLRLRIPSYRYLLP